jgi:hypothetical protein
MHAPEDEFNRFCKGSYTVQYCHKNARTILPSQVTWALQEADLERLEGVSVLQKTV